MLGPRGIEGMGKEAPFPISPSPIRIEAPKSPPIGIGAFRRRSNKCKPWGLCRQSAKRFLFGAMPAAPSLQMNYYLKCQE
jgi:hypothetical protein